MTYAEKTTLLALKEYAEKLMGYSDDMLNGMTSTTATRKWSIHQVDVAKIAIMATKRYNEPELTEFVLQRKWLTWQERFVSDLFKCGDIYVVEQFDDVYQIVMDTLEEKTCTVIDSYYRQEKTLAEIATELGVSNQRIQQIKEDGLRIIRHTYRCNYFKKDYVDEVNSLMQRRRECKDKLRWLEEMNKFLECLENISDTTLDTATTSGRSAVHS